jgi:hypothetical protein
MIYFDYGTETLDKWYEAYQKKVDALIEKAGYISGENWKTMKFEGTIIQKSHGHAGWIFR